jgi:lysophospholipase L1-like esterase
MAGDIRQLLRISVLRISALRVWGDRSLKSRSLKSRYLFQYLLQYLLQTSRRDPKVTHLRLLPNWVFLSLAANGLFVLCIGSLLVQTWQPTEGNSHHSALNHALSQPIGLLNPAQLAIAPAIASPAQRDRIQPSTYQDWLEQLRRDASAMATNPPDQLTVLLGDSISSNFPHALLPGRTILNQGISGENSTGLLRRLSLFDRTQPQTVFIMIGINDLLKGEEDRIVISNQRRIMRYVRQRHPNAKIVVQSILPHATEEVTWEGRDRLLAIPNGRIRDINRELKAIAQTEKVSFLDLYPIFADDQGNLRPELSTDGLHLNGEGYQVWSVALQLYLSQSQLFSQE